MHVVHYDNYAFEYTTIRWTEMLCYVYALNIGTGVFNVCSAVTCMGKLHSDKDNVVWGYVFIYL